MEPGFHRAGGLAVRLTMTPAVLAPGGSATVRLSVINETDRAMELVGCSALAMINAFRGGEWIHLDGTINGCRDIATTFRISAGDSLVQTAHVLGTIPKVGPAPRGAYVMRAEFNVPRLPDVEIPFTIR